MNIGKIEVFRKIAENAAIPDEIHVGDMDVFIAAMKVGNVELEEGENPVTFGGIIVHLNRHLPERMAMVIKDGEIQSVVHL